jgi:predicted secreted protein
MNAFEAVVLYAVVWFMTVFVVLPIGLRTQADEGEVVPGTHAGSPANFRFKRLFWKVTTAATLIWALLVGVILWSGLTVHDLDFYGRMSNFPRG